MAKILLVEDDNNLREIYGARLEAEGYTITSAGDGEEALATAVREQPDLIISDVMMPKISGFDMLDILRTTAETRNVKVIVMTALSQEEDRKRGEALGADRYIVKSQVTLDDVVTIVQEVLGSIGAAAGPAPTASASDNTAATSPGADAPSNQTSDTPAQTPEAPGDLQQEVQDFVQSSHLMNGTPPRPQQPASPEAQPPVNPADGPNNQPPVQNG